ncbi:methyl-accepting chemotaxis protein [Gracilibacillus caseinilyticus]|uniref:Methyl-accepting chemotaxis protein n=1 Tax=Gracilibacillus caseinilyticus TaxID=2932256 RepID=A0ABY4EY09_9BACI|nr:methyl-accepting chemotaxis protein [Gracilibacillus caseinilyticus]UOQ47051.1 methyl-accepting chemotaxis protein [Gracilibacillus caseinilyticus]
MRKLRQLRFKLPATMILLLIIPISFVGYISYQQTEILERAIVQKDDIVEISPKYNKTFDKYEAFLSDLSTLEEINYQKVQTSDLEESTSSNMPVMNNPKLTRFYEAFLSEQAKNMEYILNLYVATPDNALYMDKNTDNADLSGYKATETDWYYKATANPDQLIWSKPYLDTATDKPTITLAQTIQGDDGSIIGVVALDFDMYTLVSDMRQDLLQSTLITMAIAVVIGLLIVLLIVRLINRNIAVVKTELNYLAQGDLSRPDVKVEGKDEFEELAQAMNTLKDNLYGTINQLMMATGQVLGQSSTLKQSSEQVKEGSEQIAATMEELSSGSESQASHASDLASAMDQYNQRVNSVVEYGNQIAGESAQVMDLSQQGKQAIDSSVNQMRTIHKMVQSSYHKVQGLDKRTEEIDSIVEVIKEIADQTNLLALNAAIEAARAGESGKGFAVVADEVRKLAEQVTNSIADITNLVANIQTESNQVAQSLEAGYQEVENGTEQMRHTGDNFSTINQSIAEMVNRIKQMGNNLKEVNEHSAEMHRSVDEIAAVSQESAAAVEETAASAEETNHSMEEVSRSAQELEALAGSLEKQIEKFKIV